MALSTMMYSRTSIHGLKFFCLPFLFCCFVLTATYPLYMFLFQYVCSYVIVHGLKKCPFSGFDSLHFVPQAIAVHVSETVHFTGLHL